MLESNKEIITLISSIVGLLITMATFVKGVVGDPLKGLFEKWYKSAYISKEEDEKLDKIANAIIKGVGKYVTMSIIMNMIFFIIISIITQNSAVSHVSTGVKMVIHILVSTIVVVIYGYYDKKKNSVDYSKCEKGFIAAYYLFLFIFVKAYSSDKVVVYSYTIISFVCLVVFVINIFSSMIKILIKHSAPDALDIYILNQGESYRNIKQNNIKIHKDYIVITVVHEDKYSIVKRSKIEIPSSNIEKIIYKHYR